MDKNAISAILSASESDGAAPKSYHLDKALRDLGVPTTVGQPSNVPDGFNNYTVAQQRLLDITRTIQGNLGEQSTLTAADLLPSTASSLQGVLPNEQLDNIIASKGETYWQFRQGENQTIEAFQVNSNATDSSTGRPALTKTEVAEKLATRIDQTIPNGMLPKVLDDLGSHELGQLAYRTGADGAIDHVVHKQAGKLGILGAAATLALAATNANASQGSAYDKAKVFANEAIKAVPGFTFAGELKNGNYKEAVLDAAGWLPAGILTAYAREPKVQAIIDALPEDHKQLNDMLHNPKTPYIDRYLADYQLLYLDAEEKGNLLDGIDASNKLTELAEKKLELQAQWKKDADTFEAATKDPETNWREFAKNNPNLATQTATHIVAMKVGHSQAFVNSVDETLIKHTTNGIPLKGDIPAQVQVQAQEASTSEKIQLEL